jgi:hypothetical protein
MNHFDVKFLNPIRPRTSRHVRCNRDVRQFFKQGIFFPVNAMTFAPFAAAAQAAFSTFGLLPLVLIARSTSPA